MLFKAPLLLPLPLKELGEVEGLDDVLDPDPELEPEPEAEDEGAPDVEDTVTPKAPDVAEAEPVKDLKVQKHQHQHYRTPTVLTVHLPRPR